ncbi:MAG: DUF2946 family protein [Alphaproteobacteria bacterium]
MSRERMRERGDRKRGMDSGGGCGRRALAWLALLSLIFNLLLPAAQALARPEASRAGWADTEICHAGSPAPSSSRKQGQEQRGSSSCPLCVPLCCQGVAPPTLTETTALPLPGPARFSGFVPAPDFHARRDVVTLPPFSRGPPSLF